MDAPSSARAEAARLLAARVAVDPRLAAVRGLVDAFPGAEWFAVGGAVRDAFIQGMNGREGKRDYDLMVRNVPLEALADALRPSGEVNLVGRRFGVLKFRPVGAERDIDIAWPRTERAGMSGGYRDFDVQADPALPVARDLERRDFTMNAIAWNMRTGEFSDPFGGMADIAAGIVRAVGDATERFGEDYSRMLRAVRFACELGFAIEAETWQAIRRLAPRVEDVRDLGGAEERVVARETVAKEFLKALAADPARAVDLLEASGLLMLLIPELAPLAGCAQSPDHHAEGDVWTHTKLVLAALSGPEFSRLFPGVRASAETAVAALFHDIAKPLTAAKGPDGRITFHGHADEGAAMAERIAERLRLASHAESGLAAERLAWIVKMHLFPNLVSVDEVRRTTLVRHFLDDRVAGRELLHLACADAAGSRRADGAASDLSNLERLLAVLAELESRGASEHAGKAIISGEEVMSAVGIAPGPEVGRIIEALREAELTGKISTREDAMMFLKALHRDE